MHIPFVEGELDLRYPFDVYLRALLALVPVTGAILQLMDFSHSFLRPMLAFFVITSH